LLSICSSPCFPDWSGGGGGGGNPQLSVVTTVWGMSSSVQSGPHASYGSGQGMGGGGGGGGGGMGPGPGNNMGYNNMNMKGGHPPNTPYHHPNNPNNMGGYPQR